MHAIRLHAHGPAENLTYEEVPDPVPAAGQVLVHVEAAGVHLIEARLRGGTAVGPHQPPAVPMTPGGEVAGVVGALGPGVDEHWLGRRVVAQLHAAGGYAEMAVAQLEGVRPLPEGLDAATAVAVVTSGATAQGVLHVAALTPDDTVLVMSAAGGLGSLLVQAARHAGATVVGAAGGTAKTDRVRALGADVAADYRHPDWPARVRAALAGRGVTVVLDGVGGTLGRQALELLEPGGRFLLYGWASGEPTAITTQDLVARQLTATWALGPQSLPAGGRDELTARALEEAASGRWVPLMTRFPLSKAAEAHAALESRQVEGKVVLTT
ncbi:zinc-binding dehydrogenase [Streptodolium elevatio]